MALTTSKRIVPLSMEFKTKNTVPDKRKKSLHSQLLKLIPTFKFI